MNIIGFIVISGNVRRSAQLAIGDCKDKAFLRAKRWDLGNIPNTRCYSNNSVLCDDINEILENEEFWEGYNGNGEPYGLINLRLARTCGRIGDTQYSDPSVEGFNPCCEQNLSRSETCCLGEIYLPNIRDKSELFTCAQYIYRICKHSLLLSCKDSEETQRIVHQQMRMGIGVTGYLQTSEEQKGWLNECYEHLRQYDKEYSRTHRFPPSIKLTTCKPSGCSRGDMLILTNKGVLRLDEIGNPNGDEWQTVHDLQVISDSGTFETVTKFYVNGKAETKKIKTQDGMEFESTLNHRYRVISENEYVWKTVEELQVGDKLAVKIGDHPEEFITTLVQLTECEVMSQPDVLEKSLSRFLGILYADGKIEGSHLSFRHDNPDMLEWLSEFFKLKFNLVPKITEDTLTINNEYFIEWLDCNDCLFYRKEIPKIIRQASRENIISFLDGLHYAQRETWDIPVQTSRTFLTLARSVCTLEDISRNRQNRVWNEFWTDAITSIEESECETYDIEVENSHHYRLNGAISHNTLSLLAGMTPGVHPGYARHYIRRIRIASDSPLIKMLRDHNYPIEYAKNFDGTNDPTTVVVSFPHKLPDDTVIADDCTAIDQLEYVKRLQTDWSDNAVSCTVYYRKEELPEIKEWLKQYYNDHIKSVSFLLHSEHGFVQVPMEKITKEEYERMISECKPILSYEGICGVVEDKHIGEAECVGGACPIR